MVPLDTCMAVLERRSQEIQITYTINLINFNYLFPWALL